MNLTTPVAPHELGEDSSIWFKLTPLVKGNVQNPMAVLQQMTERYGGVISVNMGGGRAVMACTRSRGKR